MEVYRMMDEEPYFNVLKATLPQICSDTLQSDQASYNGGDFSNIDGGQDSAGDGESAGSGDQPGGGDQVGDHDKGHGNDSSKVDPDNPGNGNK